MVKQNEDRVLAKAEVAYNLRSQRDLAWKTIADMLGYSCFRECISVARRYAKLNDLQWPLGRDAMSQEERQELYWKENTTGEVAYNLRAGTGLGWTEIASRIGVSENSIRNCAERFALSRNLPWPLVGIKEVLDSHLAPLAYELRPFMKWTEIGEKLGISQDNARVIAERYAETNGLPPPSSPKSLGQRSYEARSWGFTWKQVAKITGTTGMSHHGAAKKYALEQGLPWPLRPKTKRS